MLDAGRDAERFPAMPALRTVLEGGLCDQAVVGTEPRGGEHGVRGREREREGGGLEVERGDVQH